MMMTMTGFANSSHILAGPEVENVFAYETVSTGPFTNEVFTE